MFRAPDLNTYACPLCDRKWKEHKGDCLWLYDSNAGAFICGYCKMNLMKKIAEHKKNSIGELKKFLED